MNELLEAAISGMNIIPTSLLVFVLVYWLVVIIGLIDLNAIDISPDHDFHVDAHSEVDVQHDVPAKEIHAHGSESVSWLNAVLAFFNLGQIPFMVFMSFLILPMWVISILTNHYLANQSVGIALLLLVPNFIVSLFIAKILTTPFVKIFSYLYKDPEHQDIIGKVCTVLLPASSEKIGQAIIKANGNTLMLNVKTATGESVEKGKNALVVEFQKDKNYYLIQQF